MAAKIRPMDTTSNIMSGRSVIDLNVKVRRGSRYRENRKQRPPKAISFRRKIPAIRPTWGSIAVDSPPSWSSGSRAKSRAMSTTAEMSSSSATSMSSSPFSDPTASSRSQTATEMPTLVAVMAVATTREGISASSRI